MRSKELNSHFARKAQHEEMIDLINASKEAKQALEVEQLGKQLKSAKELEEMRQQGNVAVQGLRNEGGLAVANTTGEFGLKRQGLANQNALETQGLRNTTAEKIAGMKEAGDTLRQGSFVDQTKAREDLFKMGAREGRFKEAVGALLAGVPGEGANQIYDRHYEPFAGLEAPTKATDNKFIPGKTEWDMRTGRPVEVQPDRVWNSRSQTLRAVPTETAPVQGLTSPDKQEAILPDFSKMGDEETYQYIKALKLSGSPLYKELLKQYQQ